VTPPKLAALKLVNVHDDRPGSLTSHIARLERIWRESQEQIDRARMLRLSCSEIETLEATG
jgi:hypothetical protein